MAKYTTADIRNLILVGHNASGKTTLGDALLFRGKAVQRLGSINDGTSVFDHEADEQERKVSIDLSFASVNVGGKEINILDAPGYSDFVGQAVCGLHAVETAVLCVNAAGGIMVNTRKMWQWAERVGVGRVISINKMDSDNIQYGALLEKIQETFGKQCVPVLIPDGEGENFTKVTNILENDSVDGAYSSLLDGAREKLMEIDDDLMMKFLEGETVTPQELAAKLPRAIAEGKVVPILCSSATSDIGVAETLDFIAKYFPAPTDVPARKGTDPEKNEEMEMAVDGTLSAQVFKAISDPFVHRLCFLRVYSGTLTNATPIFNQRIGEGKRIGGMFKPFGKEQVITSRVIAGDIVAVTKVDDLSQCDTVCDPHHLVRLDEYMFPTPMVSLAIEPKSKSDLARLSESLHKMEASDPTFKFTRDSQTAELVISGISRLHLDIVVGRLKAKFDVVVITKQPRIAYREAILGNADGHHKHKKQSGGHGQYGDVYCRVRPTERGAGFKFVNSISQGRIPQQFIPAVEKGIRETMAKGVLCNNEVVDVEVEVYDGSSHDVDSSPAAFQLAASKAFKNAFLKAKPVLLEPVVNMEVIIPSQFMGDITGDLNSRRGKIQGMDTQGDLQVITAQIPLMEIADYETQLRSATGGEGSYSMEFSHFDPLPHRLAEGVIAKSKKDEEED